MNSLRQKITVSVRNKLCNKIYDFYNYNTVDKILIEFLSKDTKCSTIRKQINHEIIKQRTFD